MHSISLDKLKILSARVIELSDTEDATQKDCEEIIVLVERIEFYILNNQSQFPNKELAHRMVCECKLIVFNLELRLSDLAERKCKSECINRIAC